MKKLIVLMLLTPMFFLANPASAEESPRNFALELRAGIFAPDIDSEFGGSATPYKDVFGDDSAWMFGLEFDYQLWQGFGTIGVFGMAHYGYLSGSGIEVSGEKSNDSTKMHLLPFTAGINYRFDYLAQRWSIPLVPVFKFGLDYAIWWIRDGVNSGSTYSDNGKNMDGAGGTFGLYGSVGLHLHLDVFEPHTATVFDNDMGVNNSYLFVEYDLHWLNDFGSDSSFDLSDHGLWFGLAFEM